MARKNDDLPLPGLLGHRIRALREERGLTQEKLAYGSGMASKGNLSNIESGLRTPSLATLQVLAERLGVDILDLFTFPDQELRHRLIDRTRRMSDAALRKQLQLSDE